MKTILFSLFCALSLSSGLFGDPILGFWKTIDEETGRAGSIVGVYKYQDKYYGRMVLTFDEETGQVYDTMAKPISKAPGIVGNPYYSGLDLIWGLVKSGEKYIGGHIVDPQKGKIYGAEMWVEKGNLVVRGKILFFGRNQTWAPVFDSDFPVDFPKPDMSGFVPVIPEVN